MSKNPIQFRPHHFLCALGYQGKGYSDAFTANMTRIVQGQLRGPNGDATVIEVIGSTDDICAPCPKKIGLLCSSQTQIVGLDDRHGAALGLRHGDRLTWGDAKARIRSNVKPDQLHELCRGCSWLELGLCTAAVAGLHSDTKAVT